MVEAHRHPLKVLAEQADLVRFPHLDGGVQVAFLDGIDDLHQGTQPAKHHTAHEHHDHRGDCEGDGNPR